MDVQRYLERIGIEGPVGPPSVGLLARLQRAHLLAVPFENLDVIAGRPIGLDSRAHYEKIVGRGRGGFCYELNGLYEWLLRELGFETRLVEAQVNGEDGFTRRFAHMAVLVDLGADGPPATRTGWFLTDVGSGDFARRPLPLAGEARSDVSGEYRVATRADGRFAAERRAGPEEAWTTKYRFTPDARDRAVFEPVCEWTQRSPDSGFTRRLVCTIAIPAGRRTLSERSLTVTRNGEATKRTVVVDDRRSVLREAFGLDYDGPVTLPEERPE